ncbi:hypothetical protein OY671_009582, partial [Metschnikowia pulcherrima]
TGRLPGGQARARGARHRGTAGHRPPGRRPCRRSGAGAHSGSRGRAAGYRLRTAVARVVGGRPPERRGQHPRAARGLQRRPAPGDRVLDSGRPARRPVPAVPAPGRRAATGRRLVGPAGRRPPSLPGGLARRRRAAGPDHGRRDPGALQRLRPAPGRHPVHPVEPVPRGAGSGPAPGRQPRGAGAH